MSTKQQSTLSTDYGLTAAPASRDFQLDADFADIVVSIRNFTGTAPTMQVTVVALVDRRLSLPYDAQTADFTLGARVKGLWSNASGTIVADADGGATGTLQLKKVTGRFQNNEPLVDDNATPGAAVVNSATSGTWIFTEDGVYADTTALAAGASTTLESIHDPSVTAGYAHLHVLTARWFRLKFTAGGGAITNLDMDVDLLSWSS
jgi:hypothetical protein